MVCCASIGVLDLAELITGIVSFVYSLYFVTDEFRFSVPSIDKLDVCDSKISTLSFHAVLCTSISTLCMIQTLPLALTLIFIIPLSFLLGV